MLRITEQSNVGRAKYVVNYFTGKQHKDGSDFYDIAIFKSKRAKERFIKGLWEANTMAEQTEGQDLIERLKVERPDVVIEVSRFEDWMRWDGDGPDPEEEGFVCCTVDVKARTIRNGEMVEGSASLCSSYYQPDEPCGEIHGYLRQMVEEALEELDAELARTEVSQ